MKCLDDFDNPCAGWRPGYCLCPHCACPDNDGPDWHVSRKVQQQREQDPTRWTHGTLYLTIHEAERLPGDPTLVSVRAARVLHLRLPWTMHC